MIRWSPEQQAVRDALRDFVQKSVEPHRRQLESGDLPPYDILRELIRTFGLDDENRVIEPDRHVAGGQPADGT